MEGLIPLLIIGAGILYSVFKGNEENKQAGERNIDKGKLNNPKSTGSPRPATTRNKDSNRESNRRRGLFDDLREEFERGMKEFEQERSSSREAHSDKGPVERRRAQFETARDSGKRIAQDTYQRSRERVEREVDTARDTMSGTAIGDNAIDVDTFSRPERQSTERKAADRKSRNQKVAERAQLIREKNRADRVQSNITRVGRTESNITREAAELARYQMDTDFIKTGEIGSYDFRIDRKTVVDGIIFAEILGKPKSRQ